MVILIVFPNQLFEHHPGLDYDPEKILLVEDSLFFGDWYYAQAFHKQKLWLHRTTMKQYAEFLKRAGFQVEYCDYDSQTDSLLKILERFLTEDVDEADEKPSFLTLEPVDHILGKRLTRYARKLQVPIEYLPHPGFLNSAQENAEYREGKNRWFMADFYKWQRKRLEILVEDGEPEGGQWSFDEQNRKKVPKKKLDSIPEFPDRDFGAVGEQTKKYVEANFASQPGKLDQCFYPTTHEEAASWLQEFLEHRFELFGDYEDAIVEGESWLWHSVLTPALNIGLLTPRQVIDAALDFADQNGVPLNSLEGFIRQIIGWREFVRATYEDIGVKMRNANHWDHHRKLGDDFYQGTTGVDPVDDVIRRVQKTGYCHHIERLMVLGGFMFVCEIDPDEVYRWFMEMFVDSYDWVMVPNVYGMSQHADGGLITTKPYFSGSAYIRKMSHYSKGPWSEIWDGLYWRWIWNHLERLSDEPRWAMICGMARKMDESKRDRHIEIAEQFLDQLAG